MNASCLPAAIRKLAQQGSLLLLAAAPVAAQGIVTTVAGSGIVGRRDGPGAVAEFNGPNGMTRDAQGNLYIADSNNHLIRRVSTTGVVTTIAGNGGPGYFDHSNALLSAFTFPFGLVLDATGTLLVADYGTGSIRKLNPGGGVSTWAGNGTSGYQDGPGPAARFNLPTGLIGDAAGNLYVLDAQNFRIRRVDAVGNVTTLAGSGVRGSVDGPAATAQFQDLTGIARDAVGNLEVV